MRRKTIVRREALCSLQDEGGAGEDSALPAVLPPLLRRVFENREVRSRGELNYSLQGLQPPKMKGMEAAVALVQEALREGQQILVVGDYDADGATAIALAVLGLRALGAERERVGYLVPNRFKFGYGLSEKIAEVALGMRPRAQLVITVDNGISSIAGVARLRAAGVAVVVTDHHLAGAELPEANAIVNPNQPGCDFPSKSLAGVGVLFYLLLALRARLREDGWFAERGIAEPNLADWLDLVALGSVADLVPLDFNNRVLVAQGVARIRAGQCRNGILALLDIVGKRAQNLRATDLGYSIAPRLNAAGRMDDISIGIECLLAEEEGRAREYALRLDEINRARREVEREMQGQAMEIVAGLGEAAGGREEGEGYGLCLFDEGWHQGIVGLVASRVKEKTNHPVIAFAPDLAESGKLRGSARSVSGLHIRDLIADIAAGNAGLIEKFGGHAMAAGLSIDAGGLEKFSRDFRARVTAHFADEPPRDEILSDGALAGEEFTLENAELLARVTPWGQRFPTPMFDGEFYVREQRVVGQEHLKMVLESCDGSPRLSAIAFRCVGVGEKPPVLRRIEAVYQLQVDEFRGRRGLQLLVEYMRPVKS